jgi:hypothetical protein
MGDELRIKHGLFPKGVLVELPGVLDEKISALEKELKEYELPMPYGPEPLSIEQKYWELGGPDGILGEAIGVEKLGAENGKFQQYEHGYIFWDPIIGAHAIYGPILEKYMELQRETGFLGYPTTDIEKVGDGRGMYCVFVGGVILYSYETKAHEVHGSLWETYKKFKSCLGILGYPTSDELPIVDTNGKMNAFENGLIEWFPGTNATVKLPKVIDLAVIDWKWSLDGPNINFYAVVLNVGDVIGLKKDPYKIDGFVHMEVNYQHQYIHIEDIPLPIIPEYLFWPGEPGEPAPWRKHEMRLVKFKVPIVYYYDDQGNRIHDTFKFLYARVYLKNDQNDTNDGGLFWGKKEYLEITNDIAHKK